MPVFIVKPEIIFSELQHLATDSFLLLCMDLHLFGPYIDSLQQLILTLSCPVHEFRSPESGFLRVLMQKGLKLQFMKREFLLCLVRDDNFQHLAVGRNNGLGKDDGFLRHILDSRVQLLCNNLI